MLASFSSPLRIFWWWCIPEVHQHICAAGVTLGLAWKVQNRLCLHGEARRELRIEIVIRSAACSGLWDRKADVVWFLMALVNY